MHAKLTEIIGINKVNINLRHPALNAIFRRIFLKINSLLWRMRLVVGRWPLTVYRWSLVI